MQISKAESVDMKRFQLLTVKDKIIYLSISISKFFKIFQTNGYNLVKTYTLNEILSEINE